MCDDHVHHDHGPTTLSWGRTTLIVGALGLLAWFGSVVFHPLPDALSRPLFFAVGPLVAIAAFAAGHFLRVGRDTVELRLAVLMHVVAGAFFGAMAVIQNVVWTMSESRFAAAGSTTVEESVMRTAWAVNDVQAALDVAWDVWLSVGAILLAVALVRHPLFGALFGAVGALAAAAVLGLNLAAYPTAPAEAGFFDPGPLLAVWYGAVLVQVGRAVLRLSRGYAGWPEPSLVASAEIHSS
ncbi:MAG: hypothetical protein R3199_08485 [Gemmatimonadota bacterium]|nr:hypothetical protein [Gemmatimonadota bacterium]